ncbi:MAG TPA: hypothetical protein PLD55_04265 [bacterium]|nr:hypothetical protein [bacterium]
MTLFGIHSITVKNTPVTLVNGKYTAGTTVTRTIRGNIQPYQPDENLLQEFGDRVQKFCAVVTSESILIDEVVVFNSDNYRVIRVKNMSNQGLVKNGNIQAIGAVFD